MLSIKYPVIVLQITTKGTLDFKNQSALHYLIKIIFLTWVNCPASNL
jgi:hypothetical protein